MHFNMLLTGLFVLSMTYTPNSDRENERMRVSMLLTKGEWIVFGYGFDENENGMIDDSENMISDCQRDNTYLFTANGKGTCSDNTIQCGTGNEEESVFNWKLTDSDSTLDMESYVSSVVTIDENKLVLAPVKPANIPLGNFLMVFKH